jgi:hypothetical protein
VGDRGNHTVGAFTPSCNTQMQRAPELRFSATLGQEPEIEVALV